MLIYLHDLYIWDRCTQNSIEYRGYIDGVIDINALVKSNRNKNHSRAEMERVAGSRLR